MDEAELLVACSQLSRRWLDRSRLLWAAWLLHGLPQRQVSPFLRAHHIGRVSAFGALLDLAAYTRAGPALDVGADPKLRFTNNGVAVANLRVAVTACIQNRDGPGGMVRPPSTRSSSGVIKPSTWPTPSARATR